jgi:hypothetical protein
MNLQTELNRVIDAYGHDKQCREVFKATMSVFERYLTEKDFDSRRKAAGSGAAATLEECQ